MLGQSESSYLIAFVYLKITMGDFSLQMKFHAEAVEKRLHMWPDLIESDYSRAGTGRFITTPSASTLSRNISALSSL
jgi:hypothetical protein